MASGGRHVHPWGGEDSPVLLGYHGPLLLLSEAFQMLVGLYSIRLSPVVLGLSPGPHVLGERPPLSPGPALAPVLLTLLLPRDRPLCPSLESGPSTVVAVHGHDRVRPCDTKVGRTGPELGTQHHTVGKPEQPEEGLRGTTKPCPWPCHGSG